MLTYTFSKREKVLLVILAVILLAVVYYRFIFVAVNDQVDSLESQIAATEDQITVDTAKSLELKSMQAAIEDYQAAGRSQIVMPAYEDRKSVV